MWSPRCSWGAHGADYQTRLIRLRREMREAIEREEYEKASQLRDEIVTSCVDPSLFEIDQ